MFEIGNSLREARVRQGLDYAQIELGTKIRSKYIKALEDEQFATLPAQPYVKGFLRTYAEFLGLDGQLYVDEYNSRFVIEGQEDASPIARRPPSGRVRRDRGVGAPDPGERRDHRPRPGPAAHRGAARLDRRVRDLARKPQL